MRLTTSHPRSDLQARKKAQKLRLPFFHAGLACTGLTWAFLTIALLKNWSYPAIAQTDAQTGLIAPNLQTERGQAFLYVNPAIGQDNSGSGGSQSPFRTIHHALQVAQPNTVILLAPGLYSTETGEVFPLQMRSGITIQGDPSTAGQGIVVRGGGAFATVSQGSQNVTFVGATNALLTGVTITNPQGHGLWIESSNPTIAHNTFSGSDRSGIRVTGTALGAIQQNRFRQNRETGLSIAGAAQPEVRENLFEQTEVGITIADSAAPLIVQNQIRRNRVGVWVQDSARPVLRRNAIDQSRESGVVALNNSMPDLGTAEDAGENQFRDNRRQDVDAARTTQTVPIAGNQLSMRQVSGRVDFAGAMRSSFPLGIIGQTVAQQPDLENSSAQPEELGRSIATTHTLTSTLSTNAHSTLVASALIGQLPPGITFEPSIAVSPTATIAAVGEGRLSSAQNSPVQNTPVQNTPVQNTITERTIAETAQSVSIPIPVPPPENAAVLMSAVRPVHSANPSGNNHSSNLSGDIDGSPSAASMPALLSPSDSALIGAVPVAVSVIVPQPFAASGVATSPRQSFPEVPMMQSALILPAPPVSSPAVPQAAPAPDMPVERGDRLALLSNVLPVPDGDAPIGNTGDLPRVSIPSGQTWSAGGAVYSPSQAALRYRVVVEASSERVQALVRSLIPSAFVIADRGRPVMQVGAFSDRDNAEDAVRLLNQRGLRAVIQRL